MTEIFLKECVGITVDVWPCGCNCCKCFEMDKDYEEEELKGVCTEYGSRTMQGTLFTPKLNPFAFVINED